MVHLHTNSEQNLFAPVGVTDNMVSTSDEPIFEIIGIQKPNVIVKVDALTLAYFDTIVSKFVDVVTEGWKKTTTPPDADDIGAVEFAKKIKVKAQNARDALIV
jgi:hypothetical protein